MKTRLTKRIKRYLRENYRHTPDRLLAKELGVSESFVRKALEQLRLKRAEEEHMTKQTSTSKKSKTSNFSGFYSSRRYFVSLLIIIGLISIGLITYFALSRIFASEESKSIREIKKILAPYKGSDLNLLVFTLDTTRADHLGCYGYKQVDTPNIDQLAKNGVLFKTAISQSPLTLPSHSSIFTGTYPLYHGVRDNGGFYLEPEHMTLAKYIANKPIALALLQTVVAPGYDAGGILTAVLQNSKCIVNRLIYGLVTDDSDDTAHNSDCYLAGHE